MLPVTIGAFNGARGSERVLIWSARSMGASRLRVLWDVVLPSAMPELLNGIRTAIALAFILLVSSELIVARQGFGYLIGFLGANGSYEGMFAVVLTVALIGSMNSFDVIQATTQGGPARTTEVLNVYIFHQFGEGLFAQAATMSLVLFLVTAALAIPIIVMLRRREQAL